MMEGVLAHSLEVMTLTSEVKELTVEGRTYKYFDLVKIGGREYQKLPFCLRILFEACIRKAASTSDPSLASVWSWSASEILNRLKKNKESRPEILFQPGRVVLQDFTGVAALVDLASMRDVLASRGENPALVDSKCPADLVVDHSVQVDFSHISALTAKQEKERRPQEQLTPLYEQPQQPPIVIQNTFPPLCPCVNPGPPLEIGYCYPAYYPMMAVQTPAPPAFVQQPHQFQEAVGQQLNSVPTHHHAQDPQIPTDNPGLPIQDEVCPFHQRMSFWAETLQKNRQSEMEKNDERFRFLKWVDSSFDNITVIPPGTGVMHQVNLEYLARVVSVHDGVLFPDSLVGTDAHTTMINGLGVLGWTVGTLEAEAVMFGHPLTVQLPKVIGVKLMGKVPQYATSTDVVLLVTKELRKQLEPSGDIFIEFFGPSVDQLSIADRSAIANLCNEYNSLTGFFPVDLSTLDYLSQTGREKHSLSIIKTYLDKVGLLRTDEATTADSILYDEVVEIYVSDIVVTISGPKKTKDKVELEDVPQEFHKSLTSKFGLTQPQIGSVMNLEIDGEIHSIQNGSILSSSIASSSNTSNPSVMLTAGVLAKKAVEAGLSIPKYVKRSLSPGSGVVTSYLQDSGVMPYLHMLGFEVMGYGCSSCVENSASASDPTVSGASSSLLCCGILAGNRNFEGRILPEIKANYLASPPLVIAYAIAGRIDIDFANEPIGKDSNDKPVFLRDIWPTRDEVQEVERRQVIPSVFKLVGNRVSYGNKEWCGLQVPMNTENEKLYQWSETSTFIRPPSYLEQMLKTKSETEELLKNMRCLLKVEDNISSDYISPAGSIVRTSPAADYLTQWGLVPRQFHSYGARRGNSEIMSRGTFSHARIKNVMKGHAKIGPFTLHQPSGVATTIFDASARYKTDQVPLVIIAGENFGRGTPRDWATKGPFLLGVRAILAISFSPGYKANMVKTGLLPVEINRETFNNLTGLEAFNIKMDLENDGECKDVEITLDKGEVVFKAIHRLDNAYEVNLFKNGGVLRQSLCGFLDGNK